MTQRIDYFFGLGSPWAYLGLAPFTALARAEGAEVVPHLIGLIEENGGIYSKNRPAVRKAYWFTDLKRWAHKRGLPLALDGREALGPIAPAEALVTAAWMTGQDWLTLAEGFHHAFWGRGEDIGTPEVRERITRAAGLDADALEQAALRPAVAARRAESTALATASGVFGLPSYLVGDQLFWGQDSLGFLESHLKGAPLVA